MQAKTDVRVKITSAIADDVGEAVELERENAQAFLEQNVSRLTDLWSDHLVVNSPINVVHDKHRVLELLENGVIAHDSYEVDIEVVQTLGDVLVVMGGDRVTFAPGSPVVHRRFTDVWRRENGEWKMFARHANVVPAQAAEHRQ